MSFNFTAKAAAILKQAGAYAADIDNSMLTREHIAYTLMLNYKKEYTDAMGKVRYEKYLQSMKDKIEDFPKDTEKTRIVLSPAVNQMFDAIHKGTANRFGKPFIDLGAVFLVSANPLYLTDDDVKKISTAFAIIDEAGINNSIASGKQSTMGEEEQEGFNWEDFVTDLSTVDSKPLVGRTKELDDTIRVLLRHDKSNPVHVGEPGVGKTAITYGLAQKIKNGDVPKELKNATVFSVDIAGMIAGTQYRGQFEERLKSVLEGVAKEVDNPILFFDEMHMLIGAGAGTNSSVDAANILKPYLTDGRIKFIGATTFNEYRQYIEKDAALARRFKPITINEPTIKDCIDIIKGTIHIYEKHHNVSYTNDAIESAVKLSVKYMNDRFLPDKAFDIIDEAGAANTMKDKRSKKIRVSDIETVVQKTCGIPKITNEADDFASVKNLDKDLEKQVFGQENAIKVVSDAIKLSKSGLGDTEKPIASFLFVGPSGVGKTELTKQIAADLKIPLIRFDMSEYQEQHSVAKLTGAPAGYVGYDDGGILTEAVRKNPHCVVLFDEIEKAHPDVYKVFLQMMDYGMLTDNKGRKADFRNTVIVMTSNAGATVVHKKAALGFGNNTEDQINTDGIMEAVNATFTPEFRNRLSKIVIFNKLNNDTSRLVVKKELKALSEKLKKRNIKASFSDEAINRLIELGVSDIYGARSVQRAVDEYIRKLFVEAIINGDNVDECTVDVDDSGEFKIQN